MNKLISMTGFIEEKEKIIPSTENEPVKDWDRLFVMRTISYCRFLKQPLTLGMFVPVSDNGEILEKPNEYDSGKWHQADLFKVQDYKKAKEKVLFKGFNIEKYKQYDDVFKLICKNGSIIYSINKPMSTVEWLLDLNYEIELTDSALKQIGIKK